MKTATKTLLAGSLVGAAFLAGTSLQASPAHEGTKDQPRSGGMMSGGMMSGGSMMHGSTGSMMNEESGGMMGMMQQMSRMMKSCNEMMESHRHHENDAGQPGSPAG